MSPFRIALGLGESIALISSRFFFGADRCFARRPWSLFERFEIPQGGSEGRLGRLDPLGFVVTFAEKTKVCL